MVIGRDRSDLGPRHPLAHGYGTRGWQRRFRCGDAAARRAGFRTPAEAAVVLEWAGAGPASYVPARGAPGWIRSAALGEE